MNNDPSDWDTPAYTSHDEKVKSFIRAIKVIAENTGASDEALAEAIDNIKKMPKGKQSTSLQEKRRRSMKPLKYEGEKFYDPVPKNHPVGNLKEAVNALFGEEDP